jgi:hypothetical protein
MRAIRIAIEEPLPQSSAAHGVATSLAACPKSCVAGLI